MSVVKRPDPVAAQLPIAGGLPVVTPPARAVFRVSATPLRVSLLLALLAWWRGAAIAEALAVGSWDARLAAAILVGLLAATAVLGVCDVRRLLGLPAGVKARTPWRLAALRFGENRLAVAALWTIGALYLAALLAPILAPFDPLAMDDVLQRRYLAPSAVHLFGTDEFGRDIFSRALFGARVSLSIGVLAVAVAISIGGVYGAVSGYVGGLVDNVLMRGIDVITSFPTIFVMLLLVAMFEIDIAGMVLVLGFTAWPGTARYIRGEILSLKEREFVEGARAIGLPGRLILTRHLLPSALAPLLVTASLMVGGMVGAEAGLSFLGIGIRPPTATWGNMVAQGQDALLVAWWIAFFPGMLLTVTVLAFSLLSDGLRDALDPKTLIRKYV
jgi:peptide/nickel transport system permease protein